MFSSLRIAAQMICMPVLPLALRRSLIALIAPLCCRAQTAGMYSPARSRDEPILEMRVCPRYLPDSCKRGLSPAKAVIARLLVKR